MDGLNKKTDNQGKSIIEHRQNLSDKLVDLEANVLAQLKNTLSSINLKAYEDSIYKIEG